LPGLESAARIEQSSAGRDPLLQSAISWSGALDTAVMALIRTCSSRFFSATVHQLRTYVSCRLVNPCARTAAGHQRFNDDCVARLLLIVAATGAGLRIAEIGGLIRALECGDRASAARARRMLTAAIEDRQAALMSLAGMLSSACGPVAEVAL